MWGVPPTAKSLHVPSPHLENFPFSRRPTQQIFIPTLPTPIPPQKKSISYSLDRQFILILILIDVQYLQKAIFNFEEGSDCQNPSSSGSLHPLKKSPLPHPQ